MLFTEAPKSEDEQGTHPFYRTRGLYQLLHLTNPVRIQRTIWLDEDDLVFVRRVLVLFDGVCSTGFVRSANRQLSKILSLSLLDRRVLAKGLSHARD